MRDARIHPTNNGNNGSSSRSRSSSNGNSSNSNTCSRQCSRHLSKYCSLQEVGLIPPEQRRHRRIHGLQLPLHPQQLLGWLVLATILIGTFATIIPTLGPQLRLPICSFLVCASFVHLISHLASLLIDPAEAAVRKQPRSQLVPEFDRSKHQHVIENGRCHLCNVDATSKRTKHCSVCNKCITRFDHHCKWLNNCIGSRNYPAFIVCLVSTITAALVILSVAVAELSLVWLESRIWHIDNATMDNVTLPISLPLPGTGSLIVITLVGVLSAVAAVLLIHLCFFHGYIAFLGVTTYEYVRNKQNKQNQQLATNASNARSHHDSDDLRNMANCFNRPAFCNGHNNQREVHFCETVNADEAAAARRNVDSSNIYICSTHTSTTTTAQITQQSNGNTMATTTIQRTDMEKERRNFHLYFSYDSRFNETSIELTSTQTVLNNGGDSQQIQELDKFDRPRLELKPSTPSPVSCCFSIMGPSTTASMEKAKQRKLRQANAEMNDGQANENKVVSTRSCTTMRRIQTFLRSRLRKSARQRAINTEACSARKNKINPLSITAPPESKPDEVAPVRSVMIESRDDNGTASSPQLSLTNAVQQMQYQQQQLQQQQQTTVPKLPPLTLPSRNRLNKSDLVLTDPIVNSLKRNQPHLRVRRSSLGHKRPRFKVSPHLTQSAQLSPIPESELSKPASPRSPPLSHFTFPPLNSS